MKQIPESIKNTLLLPLSYKYGNIVDGAERVIIKANRDSNTTPLQPMERDKILALATKLLNEYFQYNSL